MLSAIFFIMTFLASITLAIRNSAIYIFVLYQAYYFFNPPTKWWGSYIPDWSFSFYIVLTLLIISAVNWSKYKENKIFEIPQFKFLLITTILYFIAQFYAVFPLNHAIALDAIMTLTVIVFVVYRMVRTETELDIIMRGYVLFAGYMGFYVSQVGRVRNGRFEGAGMVDSPDANGLGAALAPAIILCLYYFWSRPRLLSRIFFAVVGALLLNALVQIGSRGAFLGAFAGCSLFMISLYFSSARKKHQRKAVVLVLLFGLLGVGVVTDSAFWNRMSTIKTQKLETAEVQESGSTRVYFWLAAIEMTKDHPFGAGASAFIYYSDDYIPQNINTGGSRNRAVHSTWFEVLTEIGFLGFISFSMMIFYSLVTLRRTMNQLKLDNRTDDFQKVIAIGCGFTCFLVSMTFLNRFRAEILYWFILFAACAYNIYVLKRKVEE